MGEAILQQLIAQLDRLESNFSRLGHHRPGAVMGGVDGLRSFSAALRFHLLRQQGDAAIVALIGGTGTGKSTLVNRLLGAQVSDASFLRTYTAGAIVAVGSRQILPPQWLGVAHVEAPSLPARGAVDELTIARVQRPVAESMLLVDTPDVDGDTPQFRRQADRTFRWADAVVFVVTPEKYQMRELVAYYRLAVRYAIPALFVMNKCQDLLAADDYTRQLESHGYAGAQVFMVARDDSGFEPPAVQGLGALGQAMGLLSIVPPQDRRSAMASRVDDLLVRLRDHLLEPMRQVQHRNQRLASALSGMVAPVPGVDVSPVVEELKRRLRQRSVLYRISPHQVVKRAAAVPMWMIHKFSSRQEAPPQKLDLQQVIRQSLRDQFQLLQTRIIEVLQNGVSAGDEYELHEAVVPDQGVLMSVDEAVAIADQELADLKQWQAEHFNATPRDTAILQKIARYVPWGQKALDKALDYAETAPYLMTAVLLTTSSSMGYVDQMVLGGWAVISSLMERLSNEVMERTKQANANITSRFDALCAQQVERVIAWLDEQLPPRAVLDELEAVAGELHRLAGQWRAAQ